MTVLPPGLTALPVVPPILDQIEPLPTDRAARRSPIWAAAFVALVVLTVLAGASALRDRSGPDGAPSGDPTTASVELRPAPTGAAPGA